ncbi:hypothetical protein FOC1_g10001734 [Fusarium oxysporum f. sp. cubense race 1]|uniref:Uncharacterized protein n=1 Tax=Fusarium oxysporum f. sp. cubense (strain race 1) TaxID=1229664 RepID=N4U9G4_FUSC1|nr:hypothetical protein FOC1_g10001734 [Fusarium oxysporum f. sp. cubense race 1]
MVAIASGLWWDHSKTTILAATLTLPLDYSNLLLSGLTILVTIAGSSFWNIVAFFLHDWKAKSEDPSALDLQQQVSLRNSAGATQTLWEAFKIHNAWSKKCKNPIVKQTCSVAIPASLVSAGFAIAALFTSRVANKAYSTVVARVQPNNCGFWFFNTTGNDDLPALSSMGAKGQNDTRRARSHVANFYANTSSSAAPSIFVRPTLPYDISSSAPCPIPAHDRCILGPNKAFSITSAFLNSHEMLGINAKFEDRVSIQLSLTCSPVHTDDLVQETRNEAGAFMEFFLGPIHDMTNYTYRYNKAIANKTGIGYLIQSYPTFANSSSSSNPLLWKPIPDLSPIDADVTVHFLSQNNIAYLAPVYDPWFSANGTYNITSQGITVYGSDRNVDTMVCADQYVLCNPSIASCTSPAGVLNLVNNLTSTTLNLSTTQLSTADRILYSLAQSNTYTTVANLGTAALWANNMVTGHVSFGLPEDQWKTEVIGWFQTNLAMLQAYVVDFASNTADFGSFGYVEPPRSRYQQEQCTQQLVQAVGEVQNFSVCGMLIIICVSAALVLLDCSLERIVGFVDDFYGRDSMARRARQADNKLHLLRMALGGNEWVLGRWGIPVRDGAAKYNRPSGSKDLVSYRDSKTGEDTACLQVCE